MKRFLIFSLLLCGLFLSAADKILIEYFYQPNCEDCRKVSEFILKPLQKDYTSKIQFKKYDLSNEKNFMLLISILDRLNDDSNAHVYMILDRSKVLAGYSAIEKDLFKSLIVPVKAVVPGLSASNEPVKTKGNSFKLWAVIIAGLVDGINPCVFSTLIFFMSLLAVAKIKGSRLLVIGIAYCMACFITYLLLGFGLFKVLQSLSYFRYFRIGLNWTMIGVLLIFAILSLRDAWLFAKSDGNPDKVTLQLPRKVKLLIHQIMRKGLKFKYLFAGAFFIGVAVTLLESVCTGQVYVPTLTLLSKEAGGFSKWFSLLLLYNLMFILPLIGVFALMFTGISVFKAVRLTKLNLLVGKIALAVFFLLLSALLVFI